MKTKTDQLIHELVAELKPVRVVKFQMIDVFKIFTVGLLCMIAAIAILGLRIDFREQVLNGKFIFDTTVLLLLGTFSIVASFSLSVPSQKNRSAFRLPFIVFSLFILATGTSFLVNSDPLLYLGHGFSCLYEIVAISTLPAAVLFYLVRRAASLKRDLIGALVLMSGVSFGLLGVQFTCSDDTPIHSFVWHILPACMVITFGIWLSRRLIKKM